MKSEQLFKIIGLLDDAIISEAEDETVPKTSNYIVWLKWGAVAACFAIICSVELLTQWLIPSTPIPNSNEHTQILNPAVGFSNLEELSDAMSFKVIAPSEVPEDYKTERIFALSGKIAEIRYSDGKNNLVYHMAKGSEDISGDFKAYEFKNTLSIENIMITTKGNKDLIYVAYWNREDFCFSIVSSTGLTSEQLTTIIKTIR